MRRPRRTLSALLAVAAVAGAGGYLALDRLSDPEPTVHALLVFGPDATVQARLALDGDAVLLDRDGDGDFGGAGERFASAADVKDVTFADPDGVTTYVLTGLSVRDEVWEDGTPGRAVMPSVDVRGPVAYRQYGDLFLAPPPAVVPVAHFHGPLEARPTEAWWRLPPGLVLQAGDEPTDLRMVVGTMDAARRCWVVVRSGDLKTCAFPDGVRPTVTVEYPPKVPGRPPVRATHTLSGFC